MSSFLIGGARRIWAARHSGALSIARPIHVVLLVVLALPMLPASAGAHAGLVASTPSPGMGLPQAPGAVVLRFSEPLNAQASRIEVVDQSGREVTVGPTMPVEGDPKAMRRKLDLLSPGQYTVRWTTVSTRDGHSRRGSYTFAIATASLANERIENSPVASEGWLGLLGRFAALLGLGLWAGSALLGRVATYAGVPEARRFLLGRLGPVLAFAGTTLSVVSSAVIAAGSVGGIGDVLLAGRSGRLRTALIAVSGAGVLVSPGRLALSRLFMALALSVEAGSGHSASAAWPVLAAASFAVHLAAAGAWVFAILAAALSSEGVVKALAAFSPYAIAAAALVGASGLANAALELTRPADLWSTGYGQAVLAKAAVFLAMACLGLTHHRRRRRPGVQRTQVQRPLRLELGVAGLALVVATVLVSFPNPPREAKSAEPVSGIDPVLASVGMREALSVAAPSGPFIVGLTLLPPRPGTVEVRLQIVGLEAGDGPRHARVRGRSDAGGSFDVPLAPCERGFGCFAGLTRIDGPGVWRIETSVTSNRGPVPAEARLVLPAADGSAELARAIEAMEGLRSARLDERLRASVDGPLIVAGYRFRAPDAFEIALDERRRIVIGERVFERPNPSSPWTVGPWPVGFTWPKNYYREFWRLGAAARLLGVERVGGIPSNILAFVRPELPAWFRVWVGVPDGLVRRQEMLAQGHIMEHTYSGLNEPLDLRSPL